MKKFVLIMTKRVAVCAVLMFSICCIARSDEDAPSGQTQEETLAPVTNKTVTFFLTSLNHDVTFKLHKPIGMKAVLDTLPSGWLLRFIGGSDFSDDNNSVTAEIYNRMSGLEYASSFFGAMVSGRINYVGGSGGEGGGALYFSYILDGLVDLIYGFDPTEIFHAVVSGESVELNVVEIGSTEEVSVKYGVEDGVSANVSFNPPNGSNTIATVTQPGRYVFYGERTTGDSKDISQKQLVTLYQTTVEDITPDVGIEVNDGDENDKTRLYIVPKSAAGDVTVTTTLNPSEVTEANVPISWTMAGGDTVGTNKLQRTVSKNVVGSTDLTFGFDGTDSGFKTSVRILDVNISDLNVVNKDDKVSVYVSVEPGTSVNLSLVRDGGTAGEAQFDDGTTTKVISSSQYIWIKGVTASAPEGTDNIKLTANIIGIDDELECDTELFRVVEHSFPVTFTLSDEVGVSQPNSANFQTLTAGIIHKVIAAGNLPIKYTPKITINAPDDATAQEYEVGLVQNYLSDDYVCSFSNGHSIIVTCNPTPVNDGVPSNSEFYDEIFSANDSASLGSFTKDGDVVNLYLDDVPSISEKLHLFDYTEYDGPRVLPSPTLDRVVAKMRFRTWVVVRHKPTGATKNLHHIDWETDWETEIVYPGETPDVKKTATNVTVSNGNGSEDFLSGSPVANEVIIKSYE